MRAVLPNCRTVDFNVVECMTTMGSVIFPSGTRFLRGTGTQSGDMEIFEGDLLVTSDGAMYECIYACGSFRLQIVHETLCLFRDLDDARFMTMVGSGVANPELKAQLAETII